MCGSFELNNSGLFWSLQGPDVWVSVQIQGLTCIHTFIGFAVFALYITLCCVRSLSLANADTITAKFLSRDKQKRFSSTLAKYTSLELISLVTQDDGILPRNNVQSKFRVETTTSLACIHPLELSACNDFGTSSRGSYGREYQERIGKWIMSTYNSPFFLVVKVFAEFLCAPLGLFTFVVPRATRRRLQLSLLQCGCIIAKSKISWLFHNILRIVDQTTCKRKREGVIRTASHQIGISPIQGGMHILFSPHLR